MPKVPGKFRKWLIERLGGYTELPPPVETLIVAKTKRVEPLELRLDVLTDPFDRRAIGCPEYRDYVIQSACMRFAEQIYNDKLYRADKIKDFDIGSAGTRLTLWVLPPDWKEERLNVPNIAKEVI